jgi:hypothetical protein
MMRTAGVSMSLHAPADRRRRPTRRRVYRGSRLKVESDGIAGAGFARVVYSVRLWVSLPVSATYRANNSVRLVHHPVVESFSTTTSPLPSSSSVLSSAAWWASTRRHQKLRGKTAQAPTQTMTGANLGDG